MQNINSGIIAERLGKVAKGLFKTPLDGALNIHFCTLPTENEEFSI